MNKLVPLLALALLAPAAGCKRADPQPPAPPPTPLSLLPPETQTGQRTFGCLVNGQAWTPAGSPLGGPLLSAEYYNQTIYVYATRATTVNSASVMQSIQIEIDSVNKVGVYSLYNANSRSAKLTDRVSQCLFTTDKTHQASVNITRLDLVNRIVSGRFAFTLETPGCGKIVVTDGRFDSPF